MQRRYVLHGVACSIVLLLIGLNVWIYQHRHEGYLHAPGSYSQIYYTDAVPRIASFEAQTDGSLQVRFGNGEAHVIAAPAEPTRYTIETRDGASPVVFTLDRARG